MHARVQHQYDDERCAPWNGWEQCVPTKHLSDDTRGRLCLSVCRLQMDGQSDGDTDRQDSLPTKWSGLLFQQVASKCFDYYYWICRAASVQWAHWGVWRVSDGSNIIGTFGIERYGTFIESGQGCSLRFQSQVAGENRTRFHLPIMCVCC